MQARLEILCWKGEVYWVGVLVDSPEIMSQGATIEELEENLRDAQALLAMGAEIRADR